MEQSELIKELTVLKRSVSNLAYEYIQQYLPMELDKFCVCAEPFAAIERAFNRLINELSEGTFGEGNK